MESLLLPIGFMVLIGFLLQIVMILLFRKNGYARPDDVRALLHEQTENLAALVRAVKGEKEKARRKRKESDA